jgi:hypothetical protein
MHFVTFVHEKCHSGSDVTFLGWFEHDNFGILLPNTGYTWTPGIATHFLFFYDFIIIGNMLLNVFLQ